MSGASRSWQAPIEVFLLSFNRWTITIRNENMAPDALYRRILQERFPFACSRSWTSPVQFKSINWYAFQKDDWGGICVVSHTCRGWYFPLRVRSLCLPMPGLAVEVGVNSYSTVQTLCSRRGRSSLKLCTLLKSVNQKEDLRGLTCLSRLVFSTPGETILPPYV